MTEAIAISKIMQRVHKLAGRISANSKHTLRFGPFDGRIIEPSPKLHLGKRRAQIAATLLSL